jgi:predicted dehydrogenase
VEILALLEPDIERGRGILDQTGLSADLLVNDYNDIINNPAIDAVCLVNPNCFHGPQSISAMKAGKHIFCEKPSATDFADFCRQIELEKANPKLVTFIDYIMNFDSMEKRLRDMMAENQLGTITQIQVNYRHPVNIKDDKVWKLKQSIMGDAVGTGAIHSLSVMVTLLSFQAKPIAVYATSTKAKVRDFEADPIWNILVKFDNGASGFCFCNIDSGNGYDAYHNLFGTDGCFVFDSLLPQKQKIRYWSAKTTSRKWIYPLDQQDCEEKGLPQLTWPADIKMPDSGDVIHHQTKDCVAHFIEHIKAGKQSPFSFANSAIVAEIGWAALISAAAHKEIALPLDWNKAKAFFKGTGNYQI